MKFWDGDQINLINVDTDMVEFVSPVIKHCVGEFSQHHQLFSRIKFVCFHRRQLH